MNNAGIKKGEHKMTDALRKAQAKYEGKCKLFHIRLRIDRDQDIIAWLKEQPSANAKLKEMIRAEIKMK